MILRADTAEEAAAKYRKSKKIFEDMSVNNREFVTNSEQVRLKFAEKDKANCKMVKLLGIFCEQTEYARIRQQPPRSAKRNVNYAECAQIIPDTKMRNIRNMPLLFALLMIVGWLGRTSMASNVPVTSLNLQLRCIKGGIFIGNLLPTSDVQACADNHCIETRVLEREATVMFPASVCLHEHDVRVKAKYEHETFISTILCPPSPF
ncbi:hypothetical protein ANCDUO_23266 [Ancylostoma duodenale]|uniref:Phlebovirus glycoprotein G2 fusion domain-containing protein n=1 Tax=Ancylostoma duodenale TaxID=51022 RepID=A0A0C2BS46_9BILA|nr:hypothetical protein ANCDUO_23266 [Ancylostoma duodenale]